MTEAPDFTLPADDGSTVSLGALRGRRVVLYFYATDDTETCTAQACEFRDHWAAVRRTGAVLLGVSPDGVTSHAKFRKKYRLPFTLLADADHRVAEAYGVWGEKTLFGRTYMGIRRTTFLIDERGRIVRVFENVRVKGHAAAVVRALKETGVK